MTEAMSPKKQWFVEIRSKIQEKQIFLEFYIRYRYSTFDDLKLDCIITFPRKNEYSVWKDYHFNGKHTLNSYIDCGTNEKLFLALSALRDDTPINSYYWFNNRLFKCEGLEIDRILKNNTANYLLKCRCVDNPMIISCFKERNVRKATAEEIIEHLK